jgi:hypothetical protein
MELKLTKEELALFTEYLQYGLSYSRTCYKPQVQDYLIQSAKKDAEIGKWIKLLSQYLSKEDN